MEEDKGALKGGTSLMVQRLRPLAPNAAGSIPGQGTRSQRPPPEGPYAAAKIKILPAATKTQ